MTFRRADPNAEFRLLRLVSLEGRWELGLSTYQSGTRLRMGLAGRPPGLMDFCLGHDSRIPAPVLLAIVRRLEDVREDVTAGEIDAVFPWAGTRPDLQIHLKPLLESYSPLE